MPRVTDPEADEGLSLLLGLSIDNLPSEACSWEDATVVQTSAAPQISARCLQQAEEKHSPPCSQSSDNVNQPIGINMDDSTSKYDIVEFDEKFLFEHAHSFDERRGRIVDPPVKVVNLAKMGKGYGLITTRFIRKGEVIFTEQAFEAAQLLAPSAETADGSRVRGCQHCFKSLQPITCLTDGRDDVSSNISNLPFPHLWPIDDDSNKVISVDFQAEKNPGVTNCSSPYNVRECVRCKAYFCSLTCHAAHNKRMGSCCIYSAAIAAVLNSLDRPQVGEEDSGSSYDLTPPVVLAIRLFCAITQQHREKRDKHDFHQSVFWQLCGGSIDINALEMGESSLTEDGEFTYSFESAYNVLTKVLGFSECEKQHLPLQLFHRICAIAARNCIAVTTKSPFKSYYTDLVRKTGRNTPAHKDAINAISILLGSKDGLIRGMDGLIEDLCAVKTAALFPLTARINHSCDPLCEVQCQTFTDCRIDVTAKVDISAGEELSISYIDLGPLAGKSATNKVRRRRELQARYLFQCKCTRCVDKTN